MRLIRVLLVLNNVGMKICGRPWGKGLEAIARQQKSPVPRGTPGWQTAHESLTRSLG